MSRELDLVCRWEGCGKVCLSKGGLTLHQKRVHRAPEDRVRFSCDKCWISLETQAAKTNHEKTCTGGGGADGGGAVWELWGWVSRGYYARHLKCCRGEGRGRGGGFVGDRRECEICSGMQSATNLARHRACCRRVWVEHRA